MNDIINIKEKFKVDDSHSKIRGFVCAYDENGTLVFTKENMIVESGRRFILNNGIKSDSLTRVILSTEGAAASPSDTIETLKSDYETNDNSLTFNKEDFESITIDSIGNVTGITGKNKIEEKNYFSYNIDPDALLIRCLIIFNDDEEIAAQSLGIVAQHPDQDFYIVTKDTSKQSGKRYYTKTGDTFTEFTGTFADDTNYYENLKNQEVLFSRVTFPTYHKSTSQRLTFKYYIYF